MVAKDRDSCGTGERHRRRAPVRIHEPQPLTRIAHLNVGIDNTLSRRSKFITCVGILLRQKHKAPVGDTDQGFVLKNLEGDTTFQLFMEGLTHHTRIERARNLVALHGQRLGKTHVLRACNRVVCGGVFHESANSMRRFLQVNGPSEKMFDTLQTPSNMRAPGTDTGFQQEPDMHASQNLASNMNNAR